jgi:hypothetical protein
LLLSEKLDAVIGVVEVKPEFLVYERFELIRSCIWEFGLEFCEPFSAEARFFRLLSDLLAEVRKHAQSLSARSWKWRVVDLDLEMSISLPGASPGPAWNGHGRLSRCIPSANR